MLPLRNLGKATLVPAIDHFDARDKRHQRVPSELVREAHADSVLHDDALGRCHAVLQFAQKRERHEGIDAASLHRVCLVSTQHIHVEDRLPCHETLFNAVALSVRIEREPRRAFHRGNAARRLVRSSVPAMVSSSRTSRHFSGAPVDFLNQLRVSDSSSPRIITSSLQFVHFSSKAPGSSKSSAASEIARQ